MRSVWSASVVALSSTLLWSHIRGSHGQHNSADVGWTVANHGQEEHQPHELLHGPSGKIAHSSSELPGGRSNGHREAGHIRSDIAASDCGAIGRYTPTEALRIFDVHTIASFALSQIDAITRIIAGCCPLMSRSVRCGRGSTSYRHPARGSAIRWRFLVEAYLEEEAHFSRLQTVSMFRHVWTNYRHHAWGMDELKPISGAGGDGWGSFGMTLVDSMDTLWLFGFRDEFDEAARWVERNLTFDRDVNVNLFETTIRLLGGLLSAYAFSGKPALLESARDLGNRLLVAFSDKGVALQAAGKIAKGYSLLGFGEFVSQFLETATDELKLPFSDINLLTGERDNLGGAASLAEVYTPLEWKTLALFSGNCTYAIVTDKVVDIVNKSLLLDKKGLAPIYLTPRGKRASVGGNRVSLGSRGDSFYEYLLKDAIFSGASPNDKVRKLWRAFKRALPDLVAQSVQPKSRSSARHHRRRFTTPPKMSGRRGDGGAKGGWFENGNDVQGKLLFLKEVDEKKTFPKIDHLTCFLPGALALDVIQSTWSLGKFEVPSPGTSVRLLRDAVFLLADCRRAGLSRTADSKRLRALGREVQVLRVDVRDGTFQAVVPDGGKLWFGLGCLERNKDVGERRSAKFHEDHESELMLAHGLVQTCVHMYFRTVSDLAPEISRFNAKGLVDDLGSMHNILRPETIESLFILWRATKRPIYRNWAQRLLSAFSRQRTQFGFASLHNVNDPYSTRDDMPSFFLAETVKYFFLIFSADDVLDLHKFVLGTEAHPMPTIASSGLPWACETLAQKLPSETDCTISAAMVPKVDRTLDTDNRNCSWDTKNATHKQQTESHAAFAECRHLYEKGLLNAKMLEEELAACRKEEARVVDDFPCWVGALTPQVCCLPKPRGNPVCWDEFYTYERCCNPS